MSRKLNRGERELYELACIRKTETMKAALFVDLVTGEELWVPLSQIEEMHFNAAGEGTVIMTAWIAKQKGLI